MKVFGGSIDNADIDRIVSEHFDKYFGSMHYHNIDRKQFVETFDAMVFSLRQWVDSKDLSMWKRARVFAGVEAGLQRFLPQNEISEFVTKARNVIND